MAALSLRRSRATWAHIWALDWLILELDGEQWQSATATCRSTLQQKREGTDVTTPADDRDFEDNIPSSLQRFARGFTVPPKYLREIDDLELLVEIFSYKYCIHKMLIAVLCCTKYVGWTVLKIWFPSFLAGPNRPKSILRRAPWFVRNDLELQPMIVSWLV